MSPCGIYPRAFEPGPQPSSLSQPDKVPCVLLAEENSFLGAGTRAGWSLYRAVRNLYISVSSFSNCVCGAWGSYTKKHTRLHTKCFDGFGKNTPHTDFCPQRRPFEVAALILVRLMLPSGRSGLLRPWALPISELVDRTAGSGRIRGLPSEVQSGCSLARSLCAEFQALSHICDLLDDAGVKQARTARKLCKL